MAYVPPHLRKKHSSGRSGGRSLADLAGGRTSSRGDSGGLESKIISIGRGPKPGSNDFKAFHDTYQAGKYKVHSPNCSCSSMSGLRMTFKQDLDNLVVLDGSTRTAAFTCGETGKESFRNDATSCEKKLAREIFGLETQTRAFSYDDKSKSFDVTCAQCLLSKHKNGFLAVVSPSFEEMQAAVQYARNSALYKTECGLLNKNHYHFTAALKVRTLQALCRQGEGLGPAKKKIMTQMADGGVEVPQEMVDSSESKKLLSSYPDGMNTCDWLEMPTSDVHFKVGRNLKNFLLSYFQGHRFQRHQDHKYIMVGGFIDGEHEFELDLPGGKRFLGESTLENVIRKLEQECSFKLDKEWMLPEVLVRHGGLRRTKAKGAVDVFAPGGKNAMNAFFIMSPPPL